jgi:hypothetical protein
MASVDLQSFINKFAQIDTGPRTLFVYVPLPQSLVDSLTTTQKRVAVKGDDQELDHITLVYIPDAMKDRSPEDIEGIMSSLRKVTDATKPIHAKIQGWGYFDGAMKDGEPKTALVALVDAPGLEDLHVALKKALKAKGVTPSVDHIYTAHFTFAYLKRGARVQQLPELHGEFDISEIRVAADEVHTLVLKGSVGADAAAKAASVKTAVVNSDDFNAMDMRGVSPPPGRPYPPFPGEPAPATVGEPPADEAPPVEEAEPVADDPRLRDDLVPDYIERLLKGRTALGPAPSLVPLPWNEEDQSPLPAPLGEVEQGLPVPVDAKKFAYNLNGHAELTDRALDRLTAQGYKFTPEQRVRLIQANKEVDKENLKHLMISKKTSPFHFHAGEEDQSRKLIEDYYQRSLNDNTTEGSLDALGIALHTTQDEFSHSRHDVPGGVRGLITHVPKLPRFLGGRHSPDSIEKYPELAEEATGASTDLLGRFMREHQGDLGAVGDRPMQYTAKLDDPALAPPPLQLMPAPSLGKAAAMKTAGKKTKKIKKRIRQQHELSKALQFGSPERLQAFLDTANKDTKKAGADAVSSAQRAKIQEYIRTHRVTDDDEFHRFVEGLGVSPDAAEPVVYQMAHALSKKADLVPGGVGDGKKKKLFDPEEYAMGLKVEREHTDSGAVSGEITRDHLTDDKKYYSKLDDAGLAHELHE